MYDALGLLTRNAKILVQCRLVPGFSITETNELRAGVSDHPMEVLVGPIDLVAKIDRSLVTIHMVVEHNIGRRTVLSVPLVRRPPRMAVRRPGLLGPVRIRNRRRAVLVGQGLEEAIDKLLASSETLIREHALKVEGALMQVNVVIEQEVEQNVILRDSLRLERHHANPRGLADAARSPVPRTEFRRRWAATSSSIPGTSNSSFIGASARRPPGRRAPRDAKLRGVRRGSDTSGST